MTHNVTVRDLRNNGGRVLERVANGESLTVTLDGRPVAELRPLPGRAIPAATLLARWRRLPHSGALGTNKGRHYAAAPTRRYAPR